jgi:hypothetical protein
MLLPAVALFRNWIVPKSVAPDTWQRAQVLDRLRAVGDTNPMYVSVSTGGTEIVKLVWAGSKIAPPTSVSEDIPIPGVLEVTNLAMAPGVLGITDGFQFAAVFQLLLTGFASQVLVSPYADEVRYTASTNPKQHVQHRERLASAFFIVRC